MKFLEKLDFFKPLGKGLAEVDTFMRREMPFNMSWGFPAAVLGATYFAPQIMGAIGGSKAGAGTFSANNMLSSLGLEGGGSFVPTAGNSFTLPSSAYTPAYLNKLAQLQGVDAGDPTIFQRLTGQTEQGLYDAQQPFNTKGLLGRLLRNTARPETPTQPRYTSNVAQGFEYEDLNEPFRNPNVSQQERSRKLLAQQLRLLNAYQPPASSGGSGMRTMNIQNLFDRFGTLS
jgi:hypothetical protein